MAKNVSVRYDQESDTLTVSFDNAGALATKLKTDNDAILKWVDREGDVVGFQITDVSKLNQTGPISTSLRAIAPIEVKKIIDAKPLYSGWSIIPETCIDGWCYGAITDFIDPEGCRDGDGFIQAPDGSRAGLVWDYNEQADTSIIQEIPTSRENGWGLYQVYFPKPVRTLQDMCDCFAAILPGLRERYAMFPRKS
ncbi:MAG: DUF2283 domain-containing protein [Candidatus Kapaibacterium sp.]|jgi:uncharacterized protein YuzE